MADKTKSCVTTNLNQQLRLLSQTPTTAAAATAGAGAGGAQSEMRKLQLWWKQKTKQIPVSLTSPCCPPLLLAAFCIICTECKPPKQNNAQTGFGGCSDTNLQNAFS